MGNFPFIFDCMICRANLKPFFWGAASLTQVNSLYNHSLDILKKNLATEDTSFQYGGSHRIYEVSCYSYSSMLFQNENITLYWESNFLATLW
jgi:hypothetical protein